VKETSQKYWYDADLLKYVDRIYETYPGDLVFERFLSHLNGESNVSDRTRKIYVNDLFGNYPKSAENTFCTFLGLKAIRKSPQITREVIRDYIVWLASHRVAKTSINRKLSALRCFYEYLVIEQIVPKSPIPIRTNARNSPRSSLSLKLDRRLPEFLTYQEMKVILDKSSEGTANVRNKAILELLYASGMRISEICNLNLENLDLSERKVRVIGKGSKEREVLFGIPAEKALRDYLDTARKKLTGLSSEKALFINYRGDRLSPRWIQKQLKSYARINGIEKNVHPHVIRHSFATHMLDGGADLRVVQELLGHADLSSTQIYTHVTKQQARRVYMNTHPMAKEDNPDVKSDQTE
jgi:site-specific recombinase XerD